MARAKMKTEGSAKSGLIVNKNAPGWISGASLAAPTRRACQRTDGKARRDTASSLAGRTPASVGQDAPFVARGGYCPPAATKPWPPVKTQPASPAAARPAPPGGIEKGLKCSQGPPPAPRRRPAAYPRESDKTRYV